MFEPVASEEREAASTLNSELRNAFADEIARVRNAASLSLLPSLSPSRGDEAIGFPEFALQLCSLLSSLSFFLSLSVLSSRCASSKAFAAAV